MSALLTLLLFPADLPADDARFDPPAQPVPLIFETDISGDCDDVGALAMIHHLVSLGEARLLMVGINRDEPQQSSAAAVDVINTARGRGDIPIGVSHASRTQTARKSTYTAKLAAEFPHDARPDPQMPDAVALYRRTLAAADDGSVVIASVGGTTNLAELLDSPADDASDLGGRDLVARKVKLLVQMAGQFPTSRVRRAEANMLIDPPGNAALVDRWPTPIVWSGWEVGAPIRTGQPLADLPVTSPVRRAYELHPGGGIDADRRPLSSLAGSRPSWDQTAVLYAVRGRGDLWTLVPGRPVLGENSQHTDWTGATDGRHAYLVPAASTEVIAEVINGLMLPAE